MGKEKITPIEMHVYLIKHTSGNIRCRFVREYTRYTGKRELTYYLFRNLQTGRDINLKSRTKILQEIG